MCYATRSVSCRIAKMATAILISLLAAAGLAIWLMRPRYDAFLRDRVPESLRWQLLYPASELPMVMAALQAIQDAFLLSDDDLFRLLPNDRLQDLYGATYPQGGADTMEFENLLIALSRGFGVPKTELEGLDDPTVSEIIHVCVFHGTKCD